MESLATLVMVLGLTTNGVAQVDTAVKSVLIATEEIKKDEHLLLNAYPDPISPLGKALGHRGILRIGNGEPIPAHLKGLDGRPWTIGYGRARGIKPGDKITLERAETMLHEDVVESYLACRDKLDVAWDNMNPARQSVLINMCYNMGYVKLRDFKNTIRFIREGDYKQAARNMRQSAWFKQVGARARRLCDRMETGVL